MERECLPGVRAKCPDCDGPQCTYSPGSRCEEENLNYIAPDVRAELEAYRATGLTPEEIETLKAEVDFDRLKEIWGHTTAKVEFGVTFGRLRELLQAERDGRLVVLPHPAKEGDQPPECFYGSKELCPGLTAITDDEPVENCKKCRWCSAGYFQLEAEAAVELMKGEGEHG